MPARTLDITALTCPMTWVRTKLELERMAAGEALEVRAARARRWRTCRAPRARPGTTSRSRAPRSGSCGPHDWISRARLLPRPRLRRRLGARRHGARRPSPRRCVATLTDAEIERYARQLVLPEWGAAAQLALCEASVLVIGAGALGSPGRAVPGRRRRRADRDRRRRRRRALQPAPPAAALHARPRRGEGRERRRQAALPQPRRRRRALPGARSTPTTPRRWSRARTSWSTARTRSPPATPSTPRAARRACRSSRAACSAWPGS